MSEIIDPLEKAKARALKKATVAEQAINRKQKEDARIRKLETQYAFRRVVVMGTQIIDKWDNLSASTRREIAVTLAEASLAASDQKKLIDYLPGSPRVPGEPKLSGEDPDAIEFEPIRPKVAAGG